MPDPITLIGSTILAAAGAAETTGIAGLGTIAGTTIAGTSIATIVGTSAILAATIGLQYALNKTSVPSPESGSQAIKQAIPPRIRGYWINRLAGYYMLYEAGGSGPNASFDVIAFHSGRVETFLDLYLHDDKVNVVPDLSNLHTPLTVQGFGTGWYGGGRTAVILYNGVVPQTAEGNLTTDARINQIWTDSFAGNGIAYLALICGSPADPSTFTTIFPHGKPEPSVVVKCAPTFDPRDPTQLRSDETTWRASPNPVLQLIDYLTRTDGGCGLDYDTAIAPVLSQWMTEATICENPVAYGQRYQSAGWYQFDNNPEDVIGKMTASCDGWLSENGDGTVGITVGYYREPTESALTESDIFGFSVNYGQADENRVNQIDINFTDPSQGYVSTQADSVRDEGSISLFGMRNQTLDLSWVQSAGQAQHLGERALLRLNPAMSGTFITKLYGFRYIGKRWVKLQYPFVTGLEDCVVEIQSAQIDLLNGRITFAWNLVDKETLISMQGGLLPFLPSYDFSNLLNSEYVALFEDV